MAQIMKIGYFADGAWSHDALARIVADERFEVTFIVPRFDTRDPVLRDWALRLNVPFLPVEQVNAAESVAMLKAFNADLFVSMSFNQILRRPILDAAPLGFINCHAGALPFYRGRNILNWALINDEREFGITVHQVDEGIDTGDILLQKLLPISDDDDYATLLDKAIPACGDALHEALTLIASGRAVPRRQADIHPVGTYCGRRRDGDEWIDWTWPTRRLFNFIRGITRPGPCAQAYLDDCRLSIVAARMIPAAPSYIATPGEIVGITADGAVVKTLDATLLITRCETPDGKPAKLRIGMRLCAPGDRRIRELEDRVARLERRIMLMTDTDATGTGQ
jgi:methionyl-tRNA formyltransferase